MAHRLRTALTAIGVTAAFAAATFGAVGTGVAAASPGATRAASVTDECPQTTNNAMFVRWIYLEYLSRCPDAGGLQFWTAQLDGGLNRYTFTQAIHLSDEEVGAIINGDFQLLGRDPTADELNTWLPQVRSQESDAELFATLFASDEFWNDQARWNNCPNGTSKIDCWLTQVYGDILDRAPDPSGLSYFDTLLGNNPTENQRFAVAYFDLALSPEDTAEWVNDAYGWAFDRTPDAAGKQFWVQWLQSNSYEFYAMWDQVFASQESYDVALTQPNVEIAVFSRSSSAQKAHHG